MKFKMTPNKLMIALFAIVLLSIPIATIALPKAERSENENRSLAEFPTLVNEKTGEIKWDYITVRDKPSFMDDIETYYADHLAGREGWVTTKNKLEKLIGKQEINEVYTIDNQMIQVFKEYDSEDVALNMSSMAKFQANHPELPCYIMIAPTAQEMYYSRMPTYGGYLSQKTFIEDCYKQAGDITTIDSLSYLSGHKDEYLYYRTDHHWTSLGAYYAYCSAAKALGYTAYGLNEFNIESASADFKGTLYSKTLDNSITPDTIDYYHLKDKEPKLTMTVNDGMNITTYDSLYVRDFLSVKDKYSSFTGSNAPLIDIETDVDNGKSLLIVKDSYAHALVPFLSKHYSKITMVDLRYIGGSLDMFMDVDSYSQVLFMYNAVSFSGDTSAAKIALTK